MTSTYLRYRQKIGRYIPFAPPLPSPKHTGSLSLKQQAHLALWRVLLRIYPPTLGRVYTSRQPLFLIGCHNSGTTILANLIGMHPNIINWSEAPEVWTPDDAFLNWSVLDEPPLPVPFLFDLNLYERTVQKHGHYLALIRNVFTLYALTRFKGRFLNKNPHISISIPYIEAAFPDARYIHIRRNGYAVVQSLVSNWRPILKQLANPANPPNEWSKLREAIDPVYFENPLELVKLCARYWRDLDEWAARDLQALDPNRVYYTTYEDICAEPEKILREVFAQHGLNSQRYNWGQLHHPTKYPWNEMLPMENRNFKYRERLKPEEIQAITDEVGDSLAKWGYLHTEN